MEVFLDVDLKPKTLETFFAKSLTFKDFSKLKTKSIAFSISTSEIKSIFGLTLFLTLIPPFKVEKSKEKSFFQLISSLFMPHSHFF